VPTASESHVARTRTVQRPPVIVGVYLITCICGMLDATCFLKLGGVFAEVLTGNLVLLCFAIGSIGGQSVGSISAYAVVVGAFALGAYAGGWLLQLPEPLRLRRVGFVVEWVALLAAVVAAAVTYPTNSDAAQYVVTGVLAWGMGIQNAMIRRWGIPDLATNVMTLTITGLIAESSLAGGSNPRAGRRAASVGIFALSATFGAFLTRYGVLWPLTVGLIVFTVALPILTQPAPRPADGPSPTSPAPTAATTSSSQDPPHR
jgi:uncharacterized membrane protein YoaK (UPF0700 family)